MDSDDDEETLKEQEKHERVNKKGDQTTTNGDVDNDSVAATDKDDDAVDGDDAGEIAALDEEAEMPLEELIKLYGGAFTEEAVEDDSFIKLAKKGNGKNYLYVRSAVGCSECNKAK